MGLRKYNKARMMIKNIENKSLVKKDNCKLRTSGKISKFIKNLEVFF